MWSQDLYLRALQFAASAHEGQRVPGSSHPYIVHAASVAMEVMAAVAGDAALDGDLAVACALLHDTIEDTGVTHAVLMSAFGAAVADGVAALSKDPRLPKQERLRDSLERIKRQPREVWIVKLADRVTNLQPPPAHWNGAKIAAYRVEAGQILEALGPASPMLARRLRDKLATYGHPAGA